MIFESFSPKRLSDVILYFPDKILTSPFATNELSENLIEFADKLYSENVKLEMDVKVKIIT